LFPLIHKTALCASIITMVAACTGEVTSENPSGGDPIEMNGAGGRDIAEFWTDLEVPLSQNTRMLSFEMLRAEVKRATGRSWVVSGVDQWDRNRGPLGGADYVTTFADDLTPSQRRIVLVRKMAFSVCGDLITTEGGSATRTVFTEVDPAAAVDATAAVTKTQVESLYRRFFLAEPNAADTADTLALISTLGTDGKVAWRGVCASYLGSMRFLTY
jgi:hypothetical protein